MPTNKIKVVGFLDHGAKYPYDAPDSWWEQDGMSPPPATDWAHTAARGIVANLCDRHTIKHGFERVDEDLRKELVAELAEIVRLAHTNFEHTDTRFMRRLAGWLSFLSHPLGALSVKKGKGEVGK